MPTAHSRMPRMTNLLVGVRLECTTERGGSMAATITLRCDQRHLSRCAGEVDYNFTRTPARKLGPGV